MNDYWQGFDSLNRRRLTRQKFQGLIGSNKLSCYVFLIHAQERLAKLFRTYAVGICQLNGLRTNAFRPQLSLGEYSTDEFQQECTLEVVDGQAQQNCLTLTEPCPVNSVDGVCMRVPDVQPGDAVILEGYHFYSVDARIQLAAKAPGTVVREVEAHVCGDQETPLTEVINGEKVIIADCHVHDILIIRVLPSETTVFQIASAELSAVEETSPESFGSDKVTVAAIGDLVKTFGLKGLLIALGIALVVVAVEFFVALWAPADLLIEDATSFTILDLAERTSANFPSPGSVQ